jgi:hypothetical protein
MFRLVTLYNQQIAYVNEQKTILHVSGNVFSHIQGLSTFKDVYSVVVQLCHMEVVQCQYVTKTYLYSAVLKLYILRGFKTSGYAFRLPYSFALDCSIRPF